SLKGTDRVTTVSQRSRGPTDRRSVEVARWQTFSRSKKGDRTQKVPGEVTCPPYWFPQPASAESSLAQPTGSEGTDKRNFTGKWFRQNAPSIPNRYNYELFRLLRLFCCE